MRYEDITPVMRAFVGSREGFRKAGFRAEDLFLLIQRSVRLGGRLGAFVQLKTQGKKFNLELGEVPNDGRGIEEEYKRVCAAINEGQVPPEDLDRMWKESEIFVKKVEFLVALHDKGFIMPKTLAKLS